VKVGLRMVAKLAGLAYAASKPEKSRSWWAMRHRLASLTFKKVGNEVGQLKAMAGSIGRV